MTLSAQNGVLSGSAALRLPVDDHSICWRPHVRPYTIRELDLRVPEPTGVDHIVPDLSAADLAALSANNGQEDGTEISVMVAYTTQARTPKGSGCH